MIDDWDCCKTTPAPMTNAALRERIEKAMREHDANGDCREHERALITCLDGAVSVALAEVERERDVTRQIESLNRINRERAEAAEKERDDLLKAVSGVLCDASDIPVPSGSRGVDTALRLLLRQRDDAQRALAERGHVAACLCHGRCASIGNAYGTMPTACGLGFPDCRDPRCAPEVKP